MRTSKSNASGTKFKSTEEIRSDAKRKLAKMGFIKTCRVNGCRNTSEHHRLVKGVCPSCLKALKSKLIQLQRQKEQEELAQIDDLWRLEANKHIEGSFS